MGNAMKDLEARFIHERHYYNKVDQEKMAQIITDYWLLKQEMDSLEKEVMEQNRKLRDFYR